MLRAAPTDSLLYPHYYPLLSEVVVGSIVEEPTERQRQINPIMPYESIRSPATTDDDWATDRLFPLRTWTWFDGSEE